MDISSSNLPELEKVTNKITKQMKLDIHTGHGEVLDCLFDFHDKQNMVIVTVSKEGDKFKTLHINNYGREKLKEYSVDEHTFDECCLGNHPDYGCPMKDFCATEEVWDTGVYKFKKDVVGTISNVPYDVLLFPLQFNGTKAVVEFWIPQEKENE